MAINSYITLKNSNNTLIKKFRVVLSGYHPRKEKIGTQRVTVTGKVDNQVGPIVKSWYYTLRVYETDPTDPTKSDGDTAGYGRLDHLETLFDYNNPGGTPSNKITYVDFDDTKTYTVYFTANWDPRPYSPANVGVCAVYDVPVRMLEA